jgi:sialidase-1
MYNLINKFKGLGKLLLIPLIFTSVASQCKKESLGGNSTISSTGLVLVHKPLFLDGSANELALIKLKIADDSDPASLKKINFQFSENSQLTCISSLTVEYTGPEPGISTPIQFGSSSTIKNTTEINGTQILNRGTHVFRVKFDGNATADMLSNFSISSVYLDFGTGTPQKITPDKDYTFHVAKVLRAAGQNACNTYRIPGLVTTNTGTLIAVYDNRYYSNGDLQGDIDVGMSRSINGGNSWEPMKVIMDMGEWGGKPNAENGIGDPSVLFDPTTNTIWVAALWYHGNPGKSAWGNSKPGLDPSETGQLMLVKSTDDGLTWSAPINITRQTKNPVWHLFFQGPGMGITMADGTLVFPAQYKDAAQVPHSTLIYSKDHGLSWTVGTGAKPNTTEAQIVQLEDGSLMLNMRDDQNRSEKGDKNGRAISITNDLGKTWTMHPSSNSALPEPNCMASLISFQTMIYGKMQQVLFFSNPNDKSSRIHMTIKASLDHGITWPESYQFEIYSPECYGYSCMTMIDEQTIGIVYEGVKNLYFQKIPVSSILKQ